MNSLQHNSRQPHTWGEVYCSHYARRYYDDASLLVGSFVCLLRSLRLLEKRKSDFHEIWQVEMFSIIKQHC